jgi:hypothetical protein
MRSFSCTLLAGSMLAGAGLAVGTSPAADLPRAARPKAELVAATAPLLLLDAPGVAKLSRAQLTSRPIGPEFAPPPGEMRVGLDVLVDGRPLATLEYAGKTYLPVPRIGEEYQIRVWNHGPRRIAAVVSVDGLSVINGRPASESGPGYVVAPYTSVDIKGWRRSLETVAAFRFVEPDRSYAGRLGRRENIGVIGLVAIEEQVWRPRPRLEKQEPTPSAANRALGRAGSLGTEYGRDVDSRAYYVPFVRSANRRRITLYYDTAAALRAAGVPVDQPSPQPFPADNEFAPPPPGYRSK